MKRNRIDIQSSRESKTSPMRLRSNKSLIEPENTRRKKTNRTNATNSPPLEYMSIQNPTETDEGFVSCLSILEEVSSPCSRHLTHLLKGVASHDDEINETSWLSSHTIDLVISQFARRYPDVDYLSNDFVLLALNPSTSNNFDDATDILGRKLMYTKKRPILLLCNPGNIHWTLIRVSFTPTPELQLFEPMGKPANRTGQLSFRYVPRNIIRWLDTCCPLNDGKTWLSVTISAITTRHQFTSFDCGVACLLYAEKCGLGQTKETINDSTSQEDITNYRANLQQFLKRMRITTTTPTVSAIAAPTSTSPSSPTVVELE